MADIILKNAKGTPQLYSGVTKINVPTSDGGIATYSEGGGIEEVTELPEATAENVGKIYKYQGQLYECKEIKHFVLSAAILDFMLNLTMIPSSQQMIFNYHIVDTEPNIEEMEVSELIQADVVTMTFPWYVLRDGTNAWILIDEGDGPVKLTYEEMDLGGALKGVITKITDIQDMNNSYFLHTYKNVLANNNIIDGLLDSCQSVKVKKITIPETVMYFSGNFSFDTSVTEIIFEGDPYVIKADFSHCNSLKTIDLSNCKIIIPNLSANEFDNCTVLTTIKVPQALLEQFKIETNWSAYADKMVGV